MSKQEIPTLSGQQLIDSGFNVFGLKLFLESIADFPDVKDFKPLSFVYKNIQVTLRPAPKEGE